MDSKVAAITAITREAYADLAKPAAKEVGSTAGRAAHVALMPLNAILAVAESFEKSVSRKLSKVPSKDIQKPDERLALAAINSLFHSANDPDLRDMFANLIANSMIKSSQTSTHPAFVAFINELSSEDAKLIKYLAKHARGHIKIIDIVAKNAKGKQHLIHSNAALVDKKLNDVQVVRNLGVVVENLNRLKLIEKSNPYVSKIDEYTMGQSSSALFEKQKNIIKRNHEQIVWYERNIRLTDLGLEFAISAVYPPGYKIGICPGCGQKIIETPGIKNVKAS